jgi:GTP1/Obg family GTP-binding protein
MEYVFVEPMSMASLFVLFIAFLVLFVYLTYLFIKRTKISKLKKIPTALVVGFPNSGKTFIVKELSRGGKGVFDKILNISYADVMHEGIVKLKILDHQDIFSVDGKIDHGTVDGLKSINPNYIIDIIDVSYFSEPIGNQINKINRINERFDGKKFFLVANKVDKSSKKKIKKIEEIFGKKYYKIRINKPEDVEKLRKDLMRLLKIS